MTELAIAVAVTNLIIACLVRGWCNKRIDEISNPKNWKDRK